jgi:hypothetical protein
MARVPAGIELGPPQRGKEASTRSAKGRKCEAIECSTILSTYNRSAFCFLHAQPDFRHALQR